MTSFTRRGETSLFYGRAEVPLAHFCANLVARALATGSVVAIVDDRHDAADLKTRVGDLTERLKISGTVLTVEPDPNARHLLKEYEHLVDEALLMHGHEDGKPILIVRDYSSGSPGAHIDDVWFAATASDGSPGNSRFTHSRSLAHRFNAAVCTFTMIQPYQHRACWVLADRVFTVGDPNPGSYRLTVQQVTPTADDPPVRLTGSLCSRTLLFEEDATAKPLPGRGRAA